MAQGAGRGCPSSPAPGGVCREHPGALTPILEATGSAAAVAPPRAGIFAGAEGTRVEMQFYN